MSSVTTRRAGLGDSVRSEGLLRLGYTLSHGSLEPFRAGGGRQGPRDRFQLVLNLEKTKMTLYCLPEV